MALCEVVSEAEVGEAPSASCHDIIQVQVIMVEAEEEEACWCEAQPPVGV